ncbi:MAG: hypothetical protein LBJ00_17510, partial [Planctomycetaceae bacterium]|nr:hypothetical protein [Planctomycetaceae bacterium]
RQTPVCWMSPEDVTFDDAVKGINKIPNGIGSEHDRSVNVGMFDGRVKVLRENLALEILKAALTIAGGENETLP